jgi:hypothetical protein
MKYTHGNIEKKKRAFYTQQANKRLSITPEKSGCKVANQNEYRAP